MKVKIALALTAAVLLNLPLLAYAQGPAGQPGGQRAGGPVMAAMCTTSNYTDVAAKALGMDALGAGPFTRRG